ncbi:MAG TPA: hypothetical protein VN823_05365 [Stellaceae bacterium]|nr:hypothetical protein [Stellaceae bacterium]
MGTYHFYFLDGANHIQAAEEHVFEHDTQAIENGDAIYIQHGGHAMEIWQARRLVRRQEMAEPDFS